MSSPLPKIFKCSCLFALVILTFVNASTQPVTTTNDISQVPLSGGVNNNGVRIPAAAGRVGSVSDLIASKTGYAISETGRSLGILTLAILIGIPVIIVAIIFFLIPFPIAVGRRTARMAQEVLESDECVERVACEVLRFSRGMEYENEWLRRILSDDAMNSNSNTWIRRVSKGVQTPKCTKFACDPIAAVTKSIR